jgi:hypothetical protein
MAKWLPSLSTWQMRSSSRTNPAEQQHIVDEFDELIQCYMND